MVKAMAGHGHWPTDLQRVSSLSILGIEHCLALAQHVRASDIRTGRLEPVTGITQKGLLGRATSRISKACFQNTYTRRQPLADCPSIAGKRQGRTSEETKDRKRNRSPGCVTCTVITVDELQQRQVAGHRPCAGCAAHGPASVGPGERTAPTLNSASATFLTDQHEPQRRLDQNSTLPCLQSQRCYAAAKKAAILPL